MNPEDARATHREISNQAVKNGRVVGYAEILLAFILLYAAYSRFAFPLMPTADWDTWGYLYPGLAKLTGHGFVHTYGRNFVYPGWIYLILASSHDFRAISVAQHALGIGSGILLWTCWRQWQASFVEAKLPPWLYRLLGLCLVGFFEQSASVIRYEHDIRPESVFPFFLLLELNLLMAFGRQWFVLGNARRASLEAAFAVFIAVALYQLKPSFALASGGVLVGLTVIGLLPQKKENRSPWILPGAIASAVVVSGVCFVWPERYLSKDDRMSVLFLPETLLTIHANIVSDEMAADLHNHRRTRWSDDALGEIQNNLAKEIGYASEATRAPYPSLGFNPDYLLENEKSFCFWMNTKFTPQEVADFDFHYYAASWVHQPVRMLGKILNQLRVFYASRCPAYWVTKSIDLSHFYRKGISLFRSQQAYLDAMASYPAADAYYTGIRAMGRSSLTYPRGTMMTTLNGWASVMFEPLLILFLVAAGCVWGFPKSDRARAVRAHLLPPMILLLVTHGLIFGNCLTIAIVHSLDVDRYSFNLVGLCAFVTMATMVWLTEFALAIKRCTGATPGWGLHP